MKFFNHPFLLIAAGIVIVLRLFTTGITRSSIVFAFLVLFLILKGFVEIAAQHQHKLADVLKIASILSLRGHLEIAPGPAYRLFRNSYL
jgi:hypothetical protein